MAVLFGAAAAVAVLLLLVAFLARSSGGRPDVEIPGAPSIDVPARRRDACATERRPGCADPDRPDRHAPDPARARDSDAGPYPVGNALLNDYGVSARLREPEGSIEDGN